MQKYVYINNYIGQSILTAFYKAGLLEINIWNDFAKLRPFLYKMILWKNTLQKGDL